MWDLNSLTEDQTCAPALEGEALTTREVPHSRYYYHFWCVCVCLVPPGVGEDETQSLVEESDLETERRNRWEGGGGGSTSYELKERQEARKNGTDLASVEC